MGGIPIPERSGHAHIKRRLLRENAFMAGEISGHYFFRELKRDDGLYAAALFLYYLSRTPYPLSQIRETFPPSHITPDIRIAAKGREDLLLAWKFTFRGKCLSRWIRVRVGRRMGNDSQISYRTSIHPSLEKKPSRYSASSSFSAIST